MVHAPTKYPTICRELASRDPVMMAVLLAIELPDLLPTMQIVVSQSVVCAGCNDLRTLTIDINSQDRSGMIFRVL